MATTVGNYGDYSFMRDSEGKQTSSTGNGLFARVFEAFAASNDARVNNAGDTHLSSLSNGELVKLGLTDERIAEVRHNLRARQATWF